MLHVYFATRLSQTHSHVLSIFVTTKAAVRRMCSMHVRRNMTEADFVLLTS